MRVRSNTKTKGLGIVAVAQKRPSAMYRNGAFRTRHKRWSCSRLRGWSHRQESNLYLALRRRPFYPLNYGGSGRDSVTRCVGDGAAECRRGWMVLAVECDQHRRGGPAEGDGCESARLRRRAGRSTDRGTGADSRPSSSARAASNEQPDQFHRQLQINSIEFCSPDCARTVKRCAMR